MSTLAALRENMADALRASITDTQVSAYALSQPTAPGIHILPGEVDYWRAFSRDESEHRGLESWQFTVQAFANFNTDIGSQMVLDEYIDPSGPKSVKAALTADKTLGGACDNLIVRRAGGYRVVDKPSGEQLLVVEFFVEVFVSP